MSAKSILRICNACLPVLVWLALQPAWADEIYKCRDSGGGILYSDKPCKGEQLPMNERGSLTVVRSTPTPKPPPTSKPAPPAPSVAPQPAAAPPATPPATPAPVNAAVPKAEAPRSNVPVIDISRSPEPRVQKRVQDDVSAPVVPATLPVVKLKPPPDSAAR